MILVKHTSRYAINLYAYTYRYSYKYTYHMQVQICTCTCAGSNLYAQTYIDHGTRARAHAHTLRGARAVQSATAQTKHTAPNQLPWSA